MRSEPETEIASNWIGHARTRLALRRTEKPATKAGQIRALWPEIEAALATGQSVKSICKWLDEDAGITLGITSLTSYISRIRRRERADSHPENPAEQLVQAQSESAGELGSVHSSGRLSITVGAPTKPSHDPLAQAMRILSRPKMDIRKIHNDGDPEGRNLI